MSSNNGQKGYIIEDEQYLNEGNTISFGQDTATMFYQEKAYFTGDKIKILKSKDRRFNKSNSQFFLTALTKTFRSFSWGGSNFDVNTLKKQLIKLPVKNGDIDFEFIEAFIRDLEDCHVARIQEYLIENGLDDHELETEEKDALVSYKNGMTAMDMYPVSEIFHIRNTKNILSRSIVNHNGHVPYLCASSENNGVSSYITYDESNIDKGNCVFIGGKTFVVSYQKDDFFSNDSHNLALTLKDETKKTRLIQLFLVSSVQNGLKHKYSWGDSISYKKIQSDSISLPTKDGKPDYRTMELIVSGLQKLIIKDVLHLFNLV